jgi:hypothetical protein
MSEAVESLKSLFEEADKKGLWFFSNYQSIWFSPKELREQHKQGRFQWGAANWQLRDPYEQFAELHSRKIGIDKQIDDLKKRINQQ